MAGSIPLLPQGTSVGDVKAGQQPVAQQHYKQFFRIRTLIGTSFPAAFLAYYIWTYVTWLRPGSNVASDTSGVVPNGQHVWWSWFVIGAVGLNISNYCLAGVEPALLDLHFKGAKDQKEKLIYHLDKSWSTLGAWKILGGESLGQKTQKPVPWESKEQQTHTKFGLVDIVRLKRSVLVLCFVGLDHGVHHGVCSRPKSKCWGHRSK